MNVKTIIYTGIMTAIFGAMLGLAVNYISQRTLRRSDDVIVGAVLGLVCGSAYSCVVQSVEKNKSDE